MSESEPCPDSVAFPAEGALIGDRPDRAWLAHGPLIDARTPAADAPSIYAPDFFLDDETPWRHAADWVDIDVRRVASASAPAIVVRPPSRGPWDVAFRDALAAIERGEIEKLVPVVFAEGTIDSGIDRITLVRLAVQHAVASPALTPYAIWDRTSGVAGATPEILFRLDADGMLETMALAGTTVLADAATLLDDSKQRHEHRVVVTFIRDALRALGADVDVGPTDVVRLPHLAHLRTPLRARPHPAVSFDAIVRALHPTPALGGQPAARAVKRLRALDRGVGRDRFGAPFGIRFPDGSAFCVVAIRNFAWRNDRLRIGAGAGLVEGSRRDEEWRELARKIDSVAAALSS